MHLLLVEDDEVIAQELAVRWRRAGIQVVVARTLQQASAALAAAIPDVVVLDLGLPDGDGVEWLKRQRERGCAVPVMALTARDRVVDRVMGLKSGADDYLIKPVALEELDARIEALIRRVGRLKGDSVQFGPLRWSALDGVASIDGQALDLLPREFQVLGILVRRAPRLVSKRVLLDELAEQNLELGDSAAEVYVSRLRRKVAGTGLEIRNMRGFGYLLVLADGGSAKGAQ